MARLACFFGVCVLCLCAGLAEAAISPMADFIQNRDYQALSTGDPIGGITTVQKASGIVPSVAGGLVAWADGRGGSVVIAGFNLANPAGGEFLVSSATDSWQEGNPFVGAYPGAGCRVVYDAAKVGNPPGDPGQALEFRLATATNSTVIDQTGLQRSPVFVNVTPANTQLAWIYDTGVASQFNGHNNTEIHIGSITAPAVYPLAATTNITSASSAPRDHLAGDGRYLVWQELRVHDLITEASSWDVMVHDLSTATTLLPIDRPTAGLSQVTPDVAGNLVVWAQEEDPAGTGATNLYFMDLASSYGPVTITTSGAAAHPAISHVFFEEGDRLTPGSASLVEAYFVVWQDHAEDDTISDYPGGNGGNDFHWDIWCQEIRREVASGEWALHLDAFPILGSADWPVDAQGRQMMPDIDGLDVVWQSQGTGTENIFVWGPVPEPCTMLLLAAAAPLVLGRRRRFGKS